MEGVPFSLHINPFYVFVVYVVVVYVFVVYVFVVYAHPLSEFELHHSSYFHRLELVLCFYGKKEFVQFPIVSSLLDRMILIRELIKKLK